MPYKRDGMVTEEVSDEVALPSRVTTRIESPEASTEVPKPVRPRLKLHPLLRDLSLTGATEFSILVSGLVLVSLFGRLLGPVELGEFLLLRRVTAWLIAGMLLGMGNALPRFIAHSVKKPDGERRAYFLAASSCLLGSTIFAAITLYLGRQFFARWLFGDPRLADLILPLCLLLAGLAAQTAVYGYYRGMLVIGRSNVLQIFHFAIIPVVVVVLLYPTHSVTLILEVTGILTIVAAGLFAMPIFRQIANNTLPELWPYVRELLKYGVPRVPGDFGGAALFALGPIIATHYLPLRQVAYLLIGSNLLMVTGYTARPLTVVLLTKFSMMLGENRLREVRAGVEYVVGAVLDLSVFASLQFVVFADILVNIWVGPKFMEGVPVVRLLLLAIPPYLFYMSLRSSIDAVTVKPRNAGNVMVALAVYLVLTGLALKFLPTRFLLESIAGSLFVALVVLGILTARTFQELFDLRIPWGRCAPSLLAAIALGAASLAFRFVQGFRQAPVMAVAFELLISGLFLGVLIKRRSPWLGFVWRMAFSSRRQAGYAAKCRAT